jgi:hypothetical protein
MKAPTREINNYVTDPYDEATPVTFTTSVF